jgi:hypothetical protein
VIASAQAGATAATPGRPRAPGSAALPASDGQIGERYRLATPTVQSATAAARIAAIGEGLASPALDAPPPAPSMSRWPALGGLALIVIACILLVIEHQPVRAGTAEERVL